MVKNVGSPMVVLQMYSLCLLKLMETNSLDFIIERGTEGFTQGPEEHKMGIKGSSTVQLYFQDCKVPVENVLGEIGKGHIIALIF
jgi:alkylation response protein AidB-like acyl-CoA dehydrogenase